MKLLNKLTILLVMSLLTITNASSQCSVDNKYFDAGEQLSYDLYIKFAATIKGGYATLSTQNVKYEGKDAYKMTLISESQGFARKVFELSDTLACYTTKGILPLAYFKDAHEGGDYTKERLTYSYPGGNNVKIRAIRHKNGDFKFDETLSFSGCTYDLMSVLFYARTLDYPQMKNGTETKVNFVTGKSKVSMRIVYNGKEAVKANDDKKYNCLKLTLYIHDDAFDGGKEAMKVYITDDNNRMPVKLETKLKVGSTRAVLKSYKGVKHAVNVVK
ncbi:MULTISPECIES: DUF3108 domain-containing protein [unclassified Dysgonomonas]|uniref:DUF3108 domain-containing protein n=1 Tax=unclassified Dysgonomonas TaxID=2630389 RepID=UPI0006807DE7|nr:MULTISPECIES: DUF3108 domain-containing protein [unclassified Dysgonomonas]MBD8348724.1 DUF3108 domain-containing protein [Dysgonomonas sp. HGC4]MBF0576191.1 DUF3108 domain-containing protein [Dysgonomonas sp. GY617]